MTKLQDIQAEIENFKTRRAKLNQEKANYEEQIAQADVQATEALIQEKEIKSVDIHGLEMAVKHRQNAITEIDKKLEQLRKEASLEEDRAAARAYYETLDQAKPELFSCLEHLYAIEESLENFGKAIAPHGASRFETDETRTVMNLYRSLKDLKIDHSLRRLEESNYLGNAFRQMGIQNQAPDPKGIRKLIKGRA